MSITKRMILGIFTVLPLLFGMAYFVLFFIFFMDVAAEKIHDPEITSEEMPRFLQSFIPMMVMIFVSVVTSIVLMIYYLVHVSNNARFDSTQKLLWVLIILFTSSIGQMAYFILEIWPDKPVQRERI